MNPALRDRSVERAAEWQAGSARRAALAAALVGAEGQPNWAELPVGEWQALVAQAVAERVAPLLVHRFHATGWPASIPPKAEKQLRAAHTAAGLKNLLMLRELSRILQALRPQPPTVVVLKGAALALNLYPTFALRPCVDLDLLLPHAALPEATQAICALGYQEEVALGANPEINRALGHHLLLRGGPQDEVQLELHWNLIGSDSAWISPPLDWFWGQTEPLKGRQGIASLAFTPTANLLYLAAHLALHHRPQDVRLIWYYDLYLLVEQRGDRLDWEDALARAREFHWAVALRRALEAASGYFGTCLPPGFTQALREAEDARTLRWLRHLEHGQQTRTGANWESWASLGLAARLRVLWASVFPSPAYMRQRYHPQPNWLWPLYYFERWFDMLADVLATLLALARRR